MSYEVKYLVVMLDSKLNWKGNTEERMKKEVNALYQCRNAIGKHSGLHSLDISGNY